MTFSKIFITLIGASILFHSCSKEKSPANNPQNYKVKTYTEEISSSYGSFSATFTFRYDNENRILAMIPEDFPENKFSFTYPSNDQYSMELYTDGVLEIKEDFFMRNSLLDSTIQYNAAKDTMSEKYYYNANKLLISKIEFEHASGPQITNSIQFTYDVAGNMVKSMDANRKIETFDYYPDLVYAMPKIAPFVQNMQKSQLVKNSIVTMNGRMVKTSVTTYTFDNEDRISSIKETLSDGTVATKSFTYY